MGNTRHQVWACCVRVAIGAFAIGLAGASARADEVKFPSSLQQGAPTAAVPAATRHAGSTVEIFRQSDGHLGAGVQIEPGLILTAAHLVASERTVVVKDDLGRERTGTVEDSNVTLDLAFVQIPISGEIGVSPLSCRLPPIGLPIEMVGHPFGREFVVMNGAVATGIRSVGRWPSLVIMNKNAFPGMSGGPVLAADGSVVALVVAATGAPEALAGPAGAVPASVICNNLPGDRPISMLTTPAPARG